MSAGARAASTCGACAASTCRAPPSRTARNPEAARHARPAPGDLTGTPAVAGVRDAATTIATGKPITADGTTGMVSKVERTPWNGGRRG